MPHRQASGRPRRRDPADVLADRLHAAAIHLLRRLRREDDAAGLSAPRLSALSVAVFGGPITIGALAAAEQVRPPTMSRLVAALEVQGLLRRVPDRTDHRIVRVEATALARALLRAGRRRRVDVLAGDIRELSAAERRALAAAIALFERLAGR